VIDDTEAREVFEQHLGELRPKLHRYCARMTGSVIDGEDVVQEALVKALEALPRSGSIANPEGWLFRIAHNAALDFLRRRTRDRAARTDEGIDMMIDPASPLDDREVAATSLRTFMRLPVAQRGSVILKDVLGYSLEEIGHVLETSIPAVKAALHRGRARLRELAQEPDERPAPVLAAPERARLAAYVERFNARDFDAVRAMLADDVRLELVNKLRIAGRDEVGKYFHNYARIHDWQFVPGFVERHPAVLVRDPGAASPRPTYFIILDWDEDSLVQIRDFYFARYATDGAELLALE
jgi:RNA polymerase sigma-70 factor (ECF subfamily)